MSIAMNQNQLKFYIIVQATGISSNPPSFTNKGAKGAEMDDEEVEEENPKHNEAN